ncbi:ESX secretion-associated protein EspG [Actinophytocola sp. NPDC049390]|uniref:ESX secretion-associated protein EspG n=1 Tax=Actinophytocola sp. NPDC049390 TaxID=3363894 RepID=UPI0037B50AB8
MRTGRGVELSVHPLLSLIRKERMGEPHPVFAGGERYVSPRFAEEAERAVAQELRDAGLGERRDYGEFLDLLGVVQHANLEYYGWITTADEAYSVLVASRGRAAVLVVRSGTRVRFEPCELDRMVETLVWRLPDVGVARGEAFSVPQNDFHAPRGRTDGGVMRRSAPARPEGARHLDALLRLERITVAKFYAARRDASGERQRSQRWLTVLDTVEGRWALSVTHARRQEWIHVAPGTGEYIGARVAELAR